MTLRRTLTALIAMMVLGLLVWAFLPRPVAVEAALVGPQTIEVVVEEEGKARIREVFTVSATIVGKLERIDLHAGDPVVAHKTVVAAIGPAAPALLDARSRAVAEAAVAAATAAVDLAGAQVTQAEATLEFRAADADRTRQLFDRSAVPRRILDNAVLDQMTAQAALDSAKASLAMRGRELESARAVLDATDQAGAETCCVELVAPVSGRVLRVLTEDEKVVMPGAPIIEIGDPSDIEIAVDLLSRDAVRVREGATAEIVGWGGPPLAAAIERIEPSAETQVSALGIDEQRVEVILRLIGEPDQWQLLGHGFRVVARIDVWRADGVEAIPVGALFRDGEDWATYVVEDGRARLHIIDLGERDSHHAQVLNGVEAGDAVILHPSDRIADGVRVSVVADPET